MNKLTVALCTYNRENFIGDSIRNILNQTYGDFELLVLDNASTDGTQRVVESFKDDRIKYMYFPENAGMTGNWRRAVDLCKTEYLSIAHDDDIMENTLFEREIEVFERDSDILFVSCRAELVDRNNEFTLGKYQSPFTEDLCFGKYEYFDFVYKHKGANFLAAPAAMFRTSCLKEIDYGFFDYAGSMSDMYWYLEINAIGKIYLIGDTLLRYRYHEGQYSYAYLSAVKEREKYIAPLLGTYLDAEKTEEIRRAYENEIQALELSAALTEQFNREYTGYFLDKRRYITPDLFARIKFLNHLARGKEKRYVIWGCGSAGIQNKEVFDLLLPNYLLTGFIDKFKTGEWEGYPIYSPDSYDYAKGDYIIISTSTGGAEVMGFLNGKGLEFKRDYMIGNIERL